MPPLFLVGGLAGRLLATSPQCPTDYGRRTCQTMAVPYAASALSPTLGPRFTSCVWLYHCAGSPSRRLLHVPVPKPDRLTAGGPARCTRHMAVLHTPTAPLHTGGPIGHLLHMPVPHLPPCSSWVGPPVAYLTWQCSMYDMPPPVGPAVVPRASPGPMTAPRASASRWARLPHTARGCPVGPLPLAGGLLVALFIGSTHARHAHTGQPAGCLSCTCASAPSTICPRATRRAYFLTVGMCSLPARLTTSRPGARLPTWRFPAPKPIIIYVDPQVTIYRCTPVPPVCLPKTGSLAPVCNVLPSVPALRLVFDPSFLAPL